MSRYEEIEINKFSQELIAFENTRVQVNIYISGLREPIKSCQVIDKNTYIKELNNMLKNIDFKISNGNYLYLKAIDKKIYKFKFDAVIGFSIIKE